MPLERLQQEWGENPTSENLTTTLTCMRKKSTAVLSVTYNLQSAGIQNLMKDGHYVEHILLSSLENVLESINN